MAPSNDVFVGAIPSQPNGSLVQYKITLTLSTGKKVSYPNNPADPYYEWYVGPVTPLWCGDFESGAGDWTLSQDWQAGPPMGLGGDPREAGGGANVLGIDLSNDGVYSATTTASFAESPEIDLEGKTGVRLQLKRWLGVEDGFYDHANLVINGEQVWTNYGSATEPQQSGVNHIDREWRFADFELGAVEASGKVKLRFELTSDEGLQFGGWTLDDVCLVTAAQGPGDPFCGNGVMDADEVCDDGNVTDGDGCSSVCDNESGDGGGGDEPGDKAGCCSASDDGRGVLVLTLITLGLVLRRRRR
jgi:MYXO-CTERM domain-containing protein